MGKGDRKTKKGKITAGSFGVRRPKTSAKSKNSAPSVKQEVKPKKPVRKKAEKTE
ncbi:MAG: 30S ribosomal protein THX [Cyclobacteriaceae bacterium]|nr:30S ribosomal protein THX [Cyclobacteriaceae bacterium]